MPGVYGSLPLASLLHEVRVFLVENKQRMLLRRIVTTFTCVQTYKNVFVKNTHSSRS